MSKHTDRSFLIGFSLPGLYQHILRGVASYQELGSRVLRQIETANAFRQTEIVKELAGILLGIPIKEYQLAAQYHLVLCKCREKKYQSDVLERIAEQSQTYKAKALISRAAFDTHQGQFESAFHYYAEALKAAPTVQDVVKASTGIATLKSLEGYNRLALKDIESLIPLLRFAEPLNYFEVINSYAVELLATNRTLDALHASSIAVASPFGPYYPEWQETLSEIKSKPRRPSTVTISRPQIEAYDPAAYDPAVELAGVSQARVEAAIEFMKENFHREIALIDLARTVNLSLSRFSSIFKTETGLSPIDYLTKLRLDRASRLLKTTFRSVKEVMVAVGYNNNSNFGRQFKRQFGATPSEYGDRAVRRH